MTSDTEREAGLLSGDAAPPTGTAVFLFTDIEGSTQLWREQPAAMRSALARHHELLQAAIRANSGYVFQIVGDAFHAAFATASAALAAAAAAQRALSAEPWPAAAVLRVRMALHAGPAEVRSAELVAGQYTSSLTLSHTSRLLGAASGGQILASAAVEALARENLPPAVTLLDLGLHSLRDLPEPEHVYQVVAPGLPSDFRPIGAAARLAGNLPAQLSSFIGRQQEVAEARALLAETRLLTLTGAGGTGKTRLALAVASEVAGFYPDGAWFVELAQVADPSLVPTAVGTALGLREQPRRQMVEVLQGFLLMHNLLLVLDNCEHLLTACADLVAQLLARAQTIKVIVTSREPLGVSGEINYRVPSLSLPQDCPQPSPEQLAGYGAVRLFIERAHAAQPAFRLTGQNAPAICDICRRLDGIPLAIELAATRARILSVEQIAGRLQDHFQLLTGGSRTALPRHQTLRALVDWSYDLLSPAEQMLLRRLSVFSGSFTLEAVERVVAYDVANPEFEALDVLARLVDRSLVVADTATAEARYRLLEMIRQYGREKLQAAGESAEARNRHLAYYRDLVLSANPFALAGKQRALLDAELDNLRAAIEWALTRSPLDALKLGSALAPYSISRGIAGEARRWLADALRASEQEPVQGDEPVTERMQWRSRAFSSLGFVNYGLGAYATAREVLPQGVALGRELGVPALIVAGLGLFAVVSALLGDSKAAIEAAAEVLSMTDAGLPPDVLAYALFALADVAREAEHDYEKAGRLAAESARIGRATGNMFAVGMALRIQGQAAYQAGDYAEARARFQEAAALYAPLGNRTASNVQRSSLADVARQQGDYLQAAALYRETLEQWRQLGNLGAVARCVECLGFIADREGDLRRAGRLWGAASALRETAGATMTVDEVAEYERCIAGARAQDPAAFAAAWLAGRSMPVAEAVNEALAPAPAA